MHSLFWKFFFSFWTALILFVVATVWTTSHFLERTRAQHQQQSPQQRMLELVTEGQAAADRGGIEGLKIWLRQIDRRRAVPLLLIDGTGADLLERPVPARIEARIQRHKRLPDHTRGAEVTRSRPLIHLDDGTTYRLIPDYQSLTLGRVLRRPQAMLMPLFLAGAISALVCFFLARYLSAPIRRLSRATQQFALGDLDQRIGPAVGRRKDEIADLARDFDHMAERVQALVQAQQQLLSDVSHELRSPLARLHLALGLAQKKAGIGVHQDLERIEREAERLDELIGQILSLSRMESREYAPGKGPVNLVELLDTVAADAAFEAGPRNCKVVVTESYPVELQGIETLLHSALENVVRNALRYTGPNTTVELSLIPDPGRVDSVLIEVRDHGPGIAEDLLPRLFEPFVRAGEARDRESGGYGLGLAIADRAVGLHGGSIEARNRPEGGLSVLIRLPIGAITAARAHQA
ncbi:MAG: ATP-binding protein [Gammaproteobacteria bacterium]|nr:ATP-binding protein [Gammaproteobacteria bacterium]